MSSGKKRDIGDPLEQVAQTGKIGGKTSSSLTIQNANSPAAQNAGGPDVENASSPTAQNARGLEVENAGSPTVQKVKSPKSQNAKGNRVQQTVYLPPDLAKWVKIQAIEEDREISEITADALEMYRNSRQNR